MQMKLRSLAHLLPCSPVPDRPWTATCPWPRGWEALTCLLSHANTLPVQTLPSEERLTQMQMSLVPQPFRPFDSLVRSQHQFIPLPPGCFWFCCADVWGWAEPPTQELIHIKFLSPGFSKQLYPKILILTTWLSLAEFSYCFSDIYFEISLSLCVKPGGGHGSPLQHSCLENPHGQRSLAGTVHGVAKSQTRLNRWAHDVRQLTLEYDICCLLASIKTELKRAWYLFPINTAFFIKIASMTLHHTNILKNHIS